jgi:hypothetical protein
METLDDLHVQHPRRTRCAVTLLGSIFVRLEITAPGQVILRRRFSSVGFFGRPATRGAVTRLLSSAMTAAARSLLLAEEPLLEEASSYDLYELTSLFGLATCSAVATHGRDGEVEVVGIVADERRRVFGRGRAEFRYGASAVSDRWAAEWVER